MAGTSFKIQQKRQLCGRSVAYRVLDVPHTVGVPYGTHTLDTVASYTRYATGTNSLRLLYLGHVYMIFDSVFHALEAKIRPVVEVAIVKVPCRKLLLENQVSKEHVTLLQSSKNSLFSVRKRAVSGRSD